LAKRLHSPSRSLQVADVGCGTGLCGPLVRDWARRLAGCDLSAGMLRLASERGVYDDLEKAELVGYLGLRPQAFDLVLSADTLCYFGDLSGVAQAAFQALRGGGRLVFTVEALDAASPDVDADAEAGHAVDVDKAVNLDDYRLLPHGRYAHSRDYLRTVASGAGFVIEDLSRELLRYESGLPVMGWLVGAIRVPHVIAQG
jgi:predicted TPR repeat methyltransferase